MDSTGLTIEQVRRHLRKQYGLFECPKKKDRLFLTEEHWKEMDWTQEEKDRNAALPHKMWNMRHDDWLWPRCHAWRGDDAYGYRALEGHPKYMPELPQLVEGRGIARWISNGDASVVEVPKLTDYDTLWTPDKLPEVVEFLERKPENPEFGKLQRWLKKKFLRVYAPSSLQKYSKRSYLLRDPHHVSYSYIIQKNEQYSGDYPPDWVAFYRRGDRWDSNDGYIVKDAFYTGLRWN